MFLDFENSKVFIYIWIWRNQSHLFSNFKTRNYFKFKFATLTVEEISFSST